MAVCRLMMFDSHWLLSWNCCMISSFLHFKELSMKYGSLCQPIAEIIPVSPVLAITLRINVAGCDCKIVSPNLSQNTNRQTIVAVRRAVLGTETKTDQRQSSKDGRRQGPEQTNTGIQGRTYIQGQRLNDRVQSTAWLLGL